MRLGYNTNGLAHHRLTDAIELLADEGYESVALTLDAGALDPYDDPNSSGASARRGPVRPRSTRALSGGRDGRRFLLNPRLKHDPTLMDPDPARRAVRVDFLRRALDLARRLDAECVSLWSGRSPTPRQRRPSPWTGWRRRLRPVIEHAEAQRHARSAFEPEPGMFIDTFARFDRLDERIRHPLFQLTVDLGHVHCVEDGSIADHLRQWGPRIVNIHIEDMVRGVHEHLMFGEGTMDFPPIFAALREIGYRRGSHVELSRHSHAGVEAVRAARGFLGSFFSMAERAGNPSVRGSG